MFFVIDTHSFLWYLTDDKRLSANARNVFDVIGNGKAIAIIPAIVLLECIDIFDKKKVKFTFQELALRLSQASNFYISEINFGLILEVNNLKGFKDLHDRIIVATAKSFKATIVSKDKIIQQLYSQCVW